MDTITKPGILRLARAGGVKNISDDSCEKIRQIIHDKIDDIIECAIIVNSERDTKTLMPDDIYDAVYMKYGVKLGKSVETEKDDV